MQVDLPLSVKTELLRGTVETVIASSANAGKGGKGSYVWAIPKRQVKEQNHSAA